LKQVNDYDNEGDDQKDVHEAARNVQAEAEKPQDDEYRYDGPQHDFSPSNALEA
jgi:hypothetical protein